MFSCPVIQQQVFHTVFYSQFQWYYQRHKFHHVVLTWKQCYGFSLLHVGLVIVTDFLDSDVILGVNKRFRCGIRLCQSYNTSNVLEIILIVHFDLYREYELHWYRCNHKKTNNSYNNIYRLVLGFLLSLMNDIWSYILKIATDRNV